MSTKHPLTVLPSLLACLVLADCAHQHNPAKTSTLVSHTADDVDHTLEVGMYMMEAPLQSEPAGISVPLLKTSEAHARQWDVSYRVMKDGSYIAYYKNVKRPDENDYLTIVGTSRPLRPQPGWTHNGIWRILGRDETIYGTGNWTMEFRTGTFELTAPDGRKATYMAIFGGPKGNPKTRLPNLCW